LNPIMIIKVYHMLQVKSYDLFLILNLRLLNSLGKFLVEIESTEDVIFNSLDLIIMNVALKESQYVLNRKTKILLLKLDFSVAVGD